MVRPCLVPAHPEGVAAARRRTEVQGHWPPMITLSSLRPLLHHWESLQTTDNFSKVVNRASGCFPATQVPVIITTNRSVFCKFARVGPKLFCYLKEERGYNKKCLERNRDYHHLNGERPQWTPNLLSNIHWHAIFHMTQLRINPLHPVISVKPSEWKPHSEINMINALEQNLEREWGMCSANRGWGHWNCEKTMSHQK